jgi:hypothetical protein
MSPSSDFPVDPAEIQANLENRIFYHGTSKRAARKILAHGLRDYSWTAETPLLKYKAKQGITRWMHDGSYGRGTYITCNWRTALYFGPVLFRIELQPATRIVHLNVPPDPKVLDTLKREFGHEILKTTPRKVMPINKRLTLEQTIQLARHHCAKYESCGWGSVKSERHERLMFDLRNILVRYGIHGWGEATDLGGIVIFATDRLKVSEIMLSLPTRKLRDEAFDPSRCYRNFDSLDALIATTRAARNPGAVHTLAWVAASNATLRKKQHLNTPPSYE